MLDLARVTAARPGSAAVDIEFMRDGRRVAGVQCMTPFGGTDFGVSGVVSPEEEGFGKENNRKRDVFAVVAFVNEHPVVLGFLFPQVSQMLFDEQGRWVWRHPSDVYMTVDANGNTEVAHPSGAFFRIGQTPQHEDLTGKDFDKVWSISRNTDKAVHIHLEQAGGRASFDIHPSGAINAESKVSIDMRAPNIRLEGEKSVALKAPSLLLDGPVTQTNGASSFAQTVSVEIDISAGGKSFVSHVHMEQGDNKPVSPPI